jgi:proteasome beta subunit
MAIQGIGAVAPLYAVYDPERKEGKIFFYDILGAEFEGVEFAVSGSGSPAVRGILHYENRWGAKPLSRIGEEEALLLSMRLLETASEFDSATGGIKADTRLFPLIKLVTPDGCRTVPANELERLYSADTGKHNPGGSND